MLLREYLQAKGYDADLCPDGEAGYKAFLKNNYDMCVLDVMMPKMDGFALAEEIRQANSDIPIIFLTAKNLKEDIFAGFQIGADDYITKPFSMEELTLRMEAILRRVRGKQHRDVAIYHIGEFTFDTKRQILARGDVQVKLTTRERAAHPLVSARQRRPAARARTQDHLDRRQLLQRPLNGCVYHQTAQAPEERPVNRDQ